MKAPRPRMHCTVRECDSGEGHTRA